MCFIFYTLVSSANVDEKRESIWIAVKFVLLCGLKQEVIQNGAVDEGEKCFCSLLAKKIRFKTNQKGFKDTLNTNKKSQFFVLCNDREDKTINATQTSKKESRMDKVSNPTNIIKKMVRETL